MSSTDHETAAFFGADSQASGGWHSTPRRDGKVFRLGDAVVGFTTSYRMGQIVRYLTKPPKAYWMTAHSKRKLYPDLHEAMVTWASGELRTALKDNGYTKVDNNREDGGTFIVGWKGRIFVIEDDFQVAEPSTGFHAVGCGAPYALGALSALDQTTDETVRGRLQVALIAAERFSNGVGSPFEYLSEGAAS